MVGYDRKMQLLYLAVVVRDDELVVDPIDARRPTPWKSTWTERFPIGESKFPAETRRTQRKDNAGTAVRRRAGTREQRTAIAGVRIPRLSMQGKRRLTRGWNFSERTMSQPTNGQ